MKKIMFSFVTLAALGFPLSSLIACNAHDKAKATQEESKLESPVAQRETEPSREVSQAKEIREGEQLTEVRVIENTSTKN
jgi:hypothetical protein